MRLTTPIEQLSRIGPTYRSRLHKLGVKTVRDLLFHIPHRYEDYSRITPISDVVPDEIVTVQGKIFSLDTKRTWKRHMHLTEALVQDETGTLRAVWFNQPYISQNLKEGLHVILSGKTSFAQDALCLSSPVYEVLGVEGIQKGETIHTGRLVPVYPETSGLSSRWLRAIIRPLFPLIEKMEDPLPLQTLTRHKLMPLSCALRQVHFPKTPEQAEEAKRRLSFEELLAIQLIVLQEKHKIQQEGAPPFPLNITRTKKFTERLPFTLTDSQRKAAWEILKDIERPHPMNRLLEGDVGSGKTLVALIAALNVINDDWQVVLMAPTEILAEQHFTEFTKRLEGERATIALYTRSHHKKTSQKVHYAPFTISKTRLTKEVGEGKIDILVGTHAVIQDGVRFAKLGLIVVDEQHRFGVQQRAKLTKKKSEKIKGNTIPHLLSMTATPIPRTLALTVYGDLDLSLLGELPGGRKKIITKVVAPPERKHAYDFIRKCIMEGRQAFIIYPLIEESEKLRAKAATKEYERLSKEIFCDLNLALLHGRMKGKEKKKIMDEFKEGKTHVLVSTSVVEVGIDVPNASVMLIEGAERFGLAQLHQFRGRVGRGEHQSYCFLFTDSTAKNTRQRLKALTSSANGFELAEEDLKIRGPGDFYGVRQSGMPDLAMAALADLSLIQTVREEAKQLLVQSSTLQKWPALQKHIATMRRTVHFE